MASTTQNLGLILPAGSEPVQVSQLNSNFQKIDSLSAPGGSAAANSVLLANKPPEYYLTPVNLLDNSDFANPINQRGQTSYTGVSYTIDRWYLWTNGYTMDVVSGGIQKSNIIAQKIPAEKIKAGKTYTAAVGMADGTIHCYSGVLSTTQGFGSWTYVRAYYSGSVYYFTMYEGLTGVIEWAALYEGTYTAETLPPYVPKPYAVELAECRRYHRPRGARSVMYATTSDWLAGSFWFDTPMRAIPSISNLYIAKAYNYSETVDVTDAAVNRNQNGIESINVPGKLTAGSMYYVEAEFNADL